MKKAFLILSCAALFTCGAKAQDAQTLFQQGKAMLEQFDKLAGAQLEAQVKNPGAPDETLGERTKLLLEGMALLQQALPLDSVKETDKNGEYKIDKKTGLPKVKTKYSKDIVPMLVNHVADVAGIGNAALQAEDWANSYKAFSAYGKILESPGMGLTPTDEARAEVGFFEGYSAYMLKDFANAFPALKRAVNLGYTANRVNDFKNSCVANIVQGFIDNKQIEEATTYIDALVASEPDNAFDQDIKGFIVEQDKGLAAALPYYEKAAELDPNFADAYLNIGRCLYQAAEDVINENPNATNAQLAPKLVPMYQKMLPIFQKVQQLEPDNNKAARFIEDINYKLDLLK